MTELTSELLGDGWLLDEEVILLLVAVDEEQVAFRLSFEWLLEVTELLVVGLWLNADAANAAAC